MNSDLIKKIIEGALLAAGKPLDLARLESLFEDEERPPRDQIKAALEEIESDCRNRGFQLKEIASGYRLQVNQELSTWVNRLWDEKPKRYSRAMLETLSLIAYRQPLTRGDIELVRGVAVSSDIIRTLQERDWVRVVGHRDVPGRPALYATTKQFLDYFTIMPVEMDPNGIVDKVRHTVRSREDYTRNHIQSLFPNIDEIKLSRVQTLLEITSSLQMIHKIVNHMFLTAKKQKLQKLEIL